MTGKRSDSLPRVHRIETAGVSLNVRDQGRGEPILLAHGMWCEGAMFGPLIAALGSEFRSITPDLRAHGSSEVPGKPWTVADLGRDYDAILDVLNVQRAVIAGFSMGGMAALHFALASPERVRALVLLSTSASAESVVRALEIKLLAGLIRRFGPERWFAREAARKTFSPKFRRTHAEQVEEWEDHIRRMSGVAQVQALEAVAGRPSLLDRLGELRAPTLIVTGAGDRIVNPSGSRLMHQGIPDSRLAILRSAGHCVPLERPAELAARIKALLADSD